MASPSCIVIQYENEPFVLIRVKNFDFQADTQCGPLAHHISCDRSNLKTSKC